jgi:hypothetical protein
VSRIHSATAPLVCCLLGAAGGLQSTRAVEYRAPSWSWVAINGAVHWDGSLKKNNEERTIADVLEVSVTRPDKNPFRVLAAEWMRVKAHLWHVKLLGTRRVKMRGSHCEGC